MRAPGGLSVRRRRGRFGLVVAAAVLGAGTLVGLNSTMFGPTDPTPTPLPPQAGCAQATTPAALCIVILGDSIGVGVPVVGEDRWWPRLRRMLQASLPGRSIEIDNWAVSGSQVDVLESAVRDQPDLATYDLAIVIEGVNDEVARPIDEWHRRYEAAIAAMQAKGLIVVVTAPPPNFDNGAFGTRYDATAAAVRDVAAGGRPLLDLAARWRADGPAVAGAYYVDYVHQSLAGQIRMAELARDVVLEAIRSR